MPHPRRFALHFLIVVKISTNKRLSFHFKINSCSSGILFLFGICCSWDELQSAVKKAHRLWFVLKCFDSFFREKLTEIKSKHLKSRVPPTSVEQAESKIQNKLKNLIKIRIYKIWQEIEVVVELQERWSTFGKEAPDSWKSGIKFGFFSII